MSRRPKLRSVNRASASSATMTIADAEHGLDLGRQAAPEAPVAGRDAHQRDREDVEDALDEHGAERPAQRRVAVDPQQVRAVDVAQLGRHEAVDEPREVQDLGGVLDPDLEARPVEQHRPALAAQREAEVEHEERDQHQRRVRAGDEARDLRQRLAVEADEHGDDRERDEDRDDRLRLAQAGPERQALDGIGVDVAGGDLARPAGRRSRPADLVGRRGVVGRLRVVGGIGHGRLTHAVVPSFGGGGRRHAPVAPGAVDQLRDGREGPHDIGGSAGHQLDIGQGGEQPFGCRRVDVEGRVRDADLEHAVRVAHGDARQAHLAGELLRALVARPADDAGVVRLHPVDQLGHRLQPRILEHRAAELVERVRDADQAALRPHGLDRLPGRPVRLHRLLQEQRDEVPVRRPDLLPDDDRQLRRRRIPRPQRPLDPVMIRDRQVRQPPRRRRLDHLPRIAQRIKRRIRMTVQIHEVPAHPIHPHPNRWGRASGAASAARRSGLPEAILVPQDLNRRGWPRRRAASSRALRSAGPATS